MDLTKDIAGFLRKIPSDVLSVVAPRVCPVCGAVLTDAEGMLCTGCLARLEYTGYQAISVNPMEQRLENLLGRPVRAMALLVYTHGEVSGRVVSAFKYAGEKALAEYTGEFLGQAWKESERFAGFDALAPVPLHPKRRRQRGYNQAEEICRGISAVTGLPVADVLERRIDTRAQASLGRDERLRNAGGIFAVKGGAAVSGLRLAVVDDVFTTGATCCAAADALLAAGATEVGVVCLCAG